MKWVLIAVPVLGIGVAMYFLLKEDEEPVPKPVTTPPPGPLASPLGTAGGIRAQQYIVRLNMALSAWRAALPVARDAQKLLVAGTAEVVLGMAKKDAGDGLITATDLKAVEDKAKNLYAEVGIKKAA